MSDYYGEINNVELSVLYYLENEFATDWPLVNVINSFRLVTEESLPTVCVELPSEEDQRLEVGSNTLLTDYLIISNIFATSNTERKALAQYTKNKIKEGSVYYTHAFTNDVLVRTAAGRWTMRSIVTNAKIDFGESAEGSDQHRHNISFTVRKNT